MDLHRPDALQPDRPLPRWGLLALAVLMLFGAFAYLITQRSSGVTLTARADDSSVERAYVVSVRAVSSAERIDLPGLGVRARLRDGRGEFPIRESALPAGDGPVNYVLREPWYRADERGSVRIAGLPAAAHRETTPAPAFGTSAPPPPAPGRETGVESAPAPPTAHPATEETPVASETIPPPEEAPPAVATPPVAPRPDWARDRALESELAGRGVSGVRILRRGRSIRLRGTVGTDQALRTVYQFMNDKGFGEVDYGVEIR